ncbi:DUF559 domain-containing protein [Mesorhizobium sp. M2A.F.Ca.ET.037.01.1.1]|uniref:DUF559 domain-containing protein n=1 Tax=unclassified Mesorhizobium TaxID=325217 RepID=UPI0032B15C82
MKVPRPRKAGERWLGRSPRRRGGTPSQPSRRSPENIARARELRHGDNQAEATLWNELKARRLGGLQIRSPDAHRSILRGFCLQEPKAGRGTGRQPARGQFVRQAAG